jgi:hypothetical protein
MPTTTNINHTVDQQQRQPPLEPLLQHLLDIHCHLTNQTCHPARHNPLAIRLPPCVTTVHAEPKRFSRAMTQHFYIIDSPSRRLQLPVIHLIGNTGNLYTVSCTLSGVSCNCPDTTTYCKHILFLLFVSGMMASPKTPFYLNMESTINQLRTYDLSNHMLDATTNSICYRSITLSCTVCKKTIRREFFICSKCYAVSHKACGKRKIGTDKRRHHGDKYDSDRHGCSIPTPSLCFTCHKPWMPFTIGYSGKYRNIHGVLKHFQYPIAVPAGTTTPVTSTCFSSGNDSKSNIPRFRSSNTNHWCGDWIVGREGVG